MCKCYEPGNALQYCNTHKEMQELSKNTYGNLESMIGISHGTYKTNNGGNY